MSEFELIEILKKKLPRTSSRVILGIGDDCAVLKPTQGNSLLTVDAMVEGVHFSPSFCQPEEIGFKSMAVNLSDIAAMGGEPVAAVVSLGVNNQFKPSFFEKVYEGIGEAAKEFSVDVVGGNITFSPKRIFISITLFGKSSHKTLTRSGAKPGDVVFVSGFLGEAAAGLDVLKKQGRKALRSFPNLCAKYLKPRPQLVLGRILSCHPGVHALIDISDGLSSELYHLAEASRVELFVEEQKIPVSVQLEKAARKLRADKLKWCLSGGEDYELLGTCSSSHWQKLKEQAEKKKIMLSPIGQVFSGKKRVILSKENREKIQIGPSGWNHLRA